MKKVLLALFALISINVFADCPGMTVSLTMINPSCNGSCDGHGYASVSGGSGNYNYFFQDASTGASVGTQVNDSISGLCAGNYRVIVHDITNACFDTTLFTLINPTSLVGTVVTNSNVTCFGGNDGSLTAVATGGTGGYFYSWNTGATTASVFGLAAGTYFCVITDANGCMTTVTGSVVQPSQLFINPGFTNASCGACDGTAFAVASGGTPPYIYYWQPGFYTTATVPNLCSGTYQVIVTDANGCSTGATVTVGTASSVVVTASSTPSACNPCDGTVTVIESGGTGPYTYDLTGMPTQTNGNYSGVCAGSLVAMVTDSQGCTGFYTVQVAGNGISGISIVDSIVAETGTGALDGSINLDVAGPTGPFTYSWSNGATTEDIYSLAGGTYTVTITDSNGDCMTYSFTVGTTPSFGYVTGTLFNDINSNCVYDSGDVGIANYYVTVTNGTNYYYGYTNQQGFYSIWVPSGNYTVAPGNTANLGSGCTSSYAVTVTNGSTLNGNDFAYTLPQIYDVCVSLYSAGIVPGFNGNYYAYVSNVGTMPASGTVCMKLPAPLVYVSSTPAGATINGDTICINYTNLAPGAYFYLNVQFYTPTNLPLGTPMVSWVDATITNGTDANPACNHYIYTRLVTGSFDPNDKTVSPAGENATGDILVNEDEFTYLVRFQNTGTGPAVNITITDTLSAMLDPFSFEMLNASHNYTVEFINGNIIKWKFENIMLPDSGSNEPGSHGFVHFRLRTMNTPIVGQVVANIANIYFDFNEPVITNTALNTYVSPNSVGEMIEENGIALYPNPADDKVWLTGANQQTHYQIYDVTGKIYSITNSNAVTTMLDVANLEPGIYFIRCMNGQDTRIVKFIKK